MGCFTLVWAPVIIGSCSCDSISNDTDVRSRRLPTSANHLQTSTLRSFDGHGAGQHAGTVVHDLQSHTAAELCIPRHTAAVVLHGERHVGAGDLQIDRDLCGTAM